MSGGGGGGGDWRPDPIQPRARSKGDTGGGAPDPCDISDLTNLNSVNRMVLATVTAGTVLQVQYDQGPPRRLLAVTANGAAVGSITSPSMPQIIQCMQAGHTYEAIVRSIHGGICQVEVRAV